MNDDEFFEMIQRKIDEEPKAYLPEEEILMPKFGENEPIPLTIHRSSEPELMLARNECQRVQTFIAMPSIETGESKIKGALNLMEAIQSGSNVMTPTKDKIDTDKSFEQTRKHLMSLVDKMARNRSK